MGQNRYKRTLYVISFFFFICNFIIYNYLKDCPLNLIFAIKSSLFYIRFYKMVSILDLCLPIYANQF